MSTDRTGQIDADRQKGLDALIATLAARDRLSEEEVRTIKEANWRFQEFRAEAEIIADRSKPGESCLLINGLAGRALYTPNGDRQLTAVHILGDFVDLHSLFLRVMDHAVVALTPCQVAFLDHKALKEITATHPHLSRMLATLIAIDAAMQRSWILCLGQSRAEGRLAHLFCELFKRLQLVDATSDYSFAFPISQTTLGDVLGLSSVHTNRTVQHLRKSGLIAWREGTVTILDWEGLVDLAAFDPTYLNIFHEDR